MLQNFETIAIEDPVDVIVEQIRVLIISGQIQPGDRLPPERKLSEKLGVGRSYLRAAIKKLEFYGIVKTLPQSGTTVTGIGLQAFEGVITDVLKFERNEFIALVETRVVLETTAARNAAVRRTDEDIVAMQVALEKFEEKIQANGEAVEEDLAFHLSIAEAGKNNVLKSLMHIITPDIVSSFKKLNVCKDDRDHRIVEEHRDLLKHIIEGNGNEAARIMQQHLDEVVEFSKQLKQI